jgi:hypothetical protein
MIRTYYIHLLITFCLVYSINGQNIKGRITDAVSKQPVPFAFIGSEKTNSGTTSDIDGYFSLKCDTCLNPLTVQVIGYVKKQLSSEEYLAGKFLNIELKPSEIKLDEIVVTPLENPANKYIRNLINNKQKLDPDELPFYSCETYSKTYFTISNKYGDENFYNTDTSKYRKEKSLLDKQYLFFIETTSEKKYRYKNIRQEKILASKVSGFKSAPFASLASQLQSFSFYEGNINVLDIKYVNPISKGTFKRYNFEIKDTVIKGTDTTLLIHFHPKKTGAFKGLKGVLYLHKTDMALENVLAEPAGDANQTNAIKIQQQYVKKGNTWFPQQIVTEILFNSININNDKNTGENRVMKFVSRQYISDINLDSNVSITKRNIEIVNEKGYEKKDEVYWTQKRKDTLSEKELNTYKVIDSIGKAEKFETKLKLVKILTTGQIPFGTVSFDLKYLLKANDYEGIRLGGGLLTNDRLSPYFSVGGFGGFGFGDKVWKYGGFLQFNFNKDKTFYLKTEIARDLQEAANTEFLGQNTSFVSTQNIRALLARNMDQISYGKIALHAPLFRFIKSSVYLKVSERHTMVPFGNPEVNYSDLLNSFVNNEAGIQLRIWPFEKFSESFLGLISKGSKAPCFYINYSQSVAGEILGYTNTFEYRKIDVRMDHKINLKVKGYFYYQIQAGKTFGKVPFSFLYSNNGSRVTNYRISAENTFETMFVNEFTSSEYLLLFKTFNTGKLFRHNKYVNPEFELVHNIGYGNLLYRETILNAELNDLGKIYTEAGLRIKNLFKSGVSTFGIGAFYRYGNYQTPEFKNNLMIKFVLGLSLE